MNDITNRDDIVELLEAFYAKALTDPEIGFFFTEVMPLSMDTHIPLITDFWETVLFGKAAYKGNVLDIHRHIHTRFPFTAAHFDRWVMLFTATVDEMFHGTIAELAKQRATSIATIMKLKTVYADHPIGNIQKPS